MTASDVEASTARWARRWAGAELCDPPSVPTLVVVAHPDDEALSAGGLIARQTRRGVPVRLVAVTDGEAAYPDLPGVIGPAELAELRRAEQDAAAHALGLGPGDVVRLGLADGQVEAHESELVDALGPLVADVGLVVAPWVRDHHCDHEAVGRATAEAVRRAAAEAGGVGTPTWSMVFWGWRHVDPDDAGDVEVIRLDLDAAEHAAREAAVSCHRSQVTDAVAQPPMLGPGDLAVVADAVERYVVDVTPRRGHTRGGRRR